MALAWQIPDTRFVKINVHYIQANEVLQNGNSNGLGVIVRNERGEKLWGALGPARGMTAVPALVWGVQSGILAALSMGFCQTHIETDNREVYDTIRVQEFIILPPDEEEAFSQFNTLFTNHYAEGETERKVSIIPLNLNHTTQYMANYGLENFQSLVQAPGIFGNLQFFLDRDMGMAIPYPEFDLQENFGEGEVVDLPPPPASPVPRESSFQCSVFIKGKGREHSKYAFTHNGLLTQQALQILEEDRLIPISKVFESSLVNLDKEIFLGIFARDIPDSAVRGTLHTLMESLPFHGQSSRPYRRLKFLFSGSWRVTELVAGLSSRIIYIIRSNANHRTCCC